MWGEEEWLRVEVCGLGGLQEFEQEKNNENWKGNMAIEKKDGLISGNAS